MSNTTYEKFSRKDNVEMVHASGIPELRRFCHTITAGAQLLEAKHFLQSALSSLLGSVELWASSFPSRSQIEEAMPDETVLYFIQLISSAVRVTLHPSLPHANRRRFPMRSKALKTSSKILSGRFFLNI